MVRSVILRCPTTMPPCFLYLIRPDAFVFHRLAERFVLRRQYSITHLCLGHCVSPRLEQRTLVLAFTDEPLSLRHSLALAVRAQDAISGRLVHLVAQRQRTRSVLDNKTLHALGGLHRLGDRQQAFCPWRIQSKNTALPPSAYNAPGKVSGNVSRPLAQLVPSRDGLAGAFDLLAHEADDGLTHVLADPLLGPGVHHIKPGADCADADGTYLRCGC